MPRIDDRQPSLRIAAPCLPGVELLEIGGGGDGDGDRPLLAPQLCLLFCDDDDGGLVAPGCQPFERIGPGQLLARAPTQLRPWVAGGRGLRSRCRLILIDAALVAMLDGRLPRFESLLLDGAPFVAAARDFWRAVDAGVAAPDRLPLLRELLRPVLAGFAASASRSAPLTAAVARTRELLHARFAEELHLDEIARAVEMSKCHLVHLFHAELGLPPHAYLIQLRVAHARRLVATGTPLADVASLTGFADQSHLTRFFRRIVGVPPGRYAARTAIAASGGSASEWSRGA